MDLYARTGARLRSPISYTNASIAAPERDLLLPEAGTFASSYDLNRPSAEVV
jgi:hypothetical protein